MKVLLLVIAVLTALATNQTKADDGFPIEVASSISHVSIQVDGKHHGVGVIVGPRFVLTTWSLLKRLLGSYAQQQIQIVAGIDDDEPTISLEIEKIHYYYDRYEVKPHSNDDGNDCVRPIHNVAMILVKGKFDDSVNQFVVPVPMVEQGYQPSRKTRARLNGFDGNLKYVKGDMTVIGLDKCGFSYKAYNRTYFGEMCAREDLPGQKPCKGDEGTPLYIEGLLAGISSWIAHCEDPTYPSVFVNVGDYRDWIDASMKIMLGEQTETYSDDFEENIFQKTFDFIVAHNEEPCEFGPKRLKINSEGCYWRCRSHNAAYGKCWGRKAKSWDQFEGQCQCMTSRGDFFLYNKINNIEKVDMTDPKCLEVSCSSP